jgi:selenocysteine lyase/cysteine desulfurase
MLNFPSLYGMAAAVRTALEPGPATIEARVLEPGTQIAATMKRAGGWEGEKTSHIVASLWADRDADSIARSLGERGIVVAARRGNVRVSVHSHSNQNDLEALRGGIERAVFCGLKGT